MLLCNVPEAKRKKKIPGLLENVTWDVGLKSTTEKNQGSLVKLMYSFMHISIYAYSSVMCASMSMYSSMCP